MKPKFGPKYICRDCGDIIQSKSVHDFASCACGNSFIDGGTDYTRVGGNAISLTEFKKSYNKNIDVITEKEANDIKFRYLLFSDPIEKLSKFGKNDLKQDTLREIGVCRSAITNLIEEKNNLIQLLKFINLKVNKRRKI